MPWLLDAAQAIRGDERHLLVVVDSVHSWSASTFSGSSEYERLNAAISALRVLSSAAGCPVLAIAERNRSSMASGGLSASAGSRIFEYAAETMLDLQRDPGVLENQQGEVPVQVVIQKNRHGVTGRTLRLMFTGALQSFRHE
jgi:replicative DNA helicase